MNRPALKLFVAVSALGLALAGCSKKDDTNPGATDAATDSIAMDLPVDTESGGASAGAGDATLAADSAGAKFLTEAMKGDNSEVKLGQLAADQGGSDAVKKFGQMLVADHSKHANEVSALASSMGVEKTEATSAEGDAAYARLKALKGDAFDRAFKEVAVKDHQKDITKYQAEASSKDPKALTDMANQTLPVLKKHLAVAQGL